MFSLIFLLAVGALVVLAIIGLAHAFSDKPTKWSHYECPHCANLIRHTAITCPYCNRNVGYRGA